MLPLLVPVALVLAYQNYPSIVEAMFGLIAFWRLWWRWKYY
jgi:hypothetical protein